MVPRPHHRTEAHIVTRVPEDRVAELAALGVSDVDIAAALGVHPRTILRRRQAAGIPSLWRPRQPPHGRPGRYERGCRCNPCLAANARRIALWRAAQQQRSTYAPRWGLRWTPDEDAILLDLGVTAARRLGRTYSACANRLDRLRNPL